MSAMMPEYLKQLLDEVERFESNLFPPHNEPGIGEREIGEVTDPWMRNVYAVAQMNAREMEQLKLDDRFSHEDHSVRIAQLDQRVDCLMEMFWLCARKQCHCWETSSVGLRKDWKIVSSEAQDKVKSVLRKLFEE